MSYARISTTETPQPIDIKTNPAGYVHGKLMEEIKRIEKEVADIEERIKGHKIVEKFSCCSLLAFCCMCSCCLYLMVQDEHQKIMIETNKKNTIKSLAPRKNGD